MIAIILITINKQKVLKSLLNTKNHVKEIGYRTIYLVRVRPPVFTLEKIGEKLVDEKGYEYKPFDIYVVSGEGVGVKIAAGAADCAVKLLKSALVRPRIAHIDEIMGNMPLSTHVRLVTV